MQSDDDRVITLLLTFLDVIKDYKTPPNKNLSWDLDKHIRTQVTKFCFTTVDDAECKIPANTLFFLRSHECLRFQYQVQYLVHYRQHCMGMGNLIKYIRYEISHVAPDLSEADAKVIKSTLSENERGTLSAPSNED